MVVNTLNMTCTAEVKTGLENYKILMSIMIVESVLIAFLILEICRRWRNEMYYF